MMKKKNLFAVLCFVLMGTYAFGQEPGDTTHVTPFTLQENQITLSVGESQQLHITPADAQVRWMRFYGVDTNYVAVVDENGLVTALKSGTRSIGVESPNGSNMQYCQVTVTDDGSIRSDRIEIAPTNECEWQDVEFSLTNDGTFKAEGVFMGNGAQPDYLNYIVTDECVFLWFDINYEDSTMMFHYQPFSLEIENCNAQTYNVYFRNKSLVMGPQETFVRYAVRRGGTTEIERIVINREEGVIYDLKGLPVMDIPKNGFYIKDGKIIYIE